MNVYLHSLDSHSPRQNLQITVSPCRIVFSNGAIPQSKSSQTEMSYKISSDRHLRVIYSWFFTKWCDQLAALILPRIICRRISSNSNEINIFMRFRTRNIDWRQFQLRIWLCSGDKSTCSSAFTGTPTLHAYAKRKPKLIFANASVGLTLFLSLFPSRTIAFLLFLLFPPSNPIVGFKNHTFYHNHIFNLRTNVDLDRYGV